MQSKRWVQSIGMIASCRWLLSGKNEQASSLQFETQDPDLGNSLSRKYRSRSLLQNRTGWEWDYPSANLSSEIMAAACGLNQTWTAAQSFNLLYPYATDETRLCRRAANKCRSDPLSHSCRKRGPNGSRLIHVRLVNYSRNDSVQDLHRRRLLQTLFEADGY